KLIIPKWGKFSGFASYSNQVGAGFLPVTGGLFIGADAAGQLAARGSFPISQDQRNTFSSRLRWQPASRLWTSLGFSYGSGLPVENAESSPQDLLPFFGPAVLNQVNFAAGRLRPSYSLDAALGIEVWRHEQRSARLQVDGLNLTNHLNVINFASLFSGTALSDPRTISFRAGFSF
ncbi:MAG TPA: TonB-dependent receptor, partial [Terriglobales bacterium]|nr:TonB-dependent receptor [Terriglobales bacterium]